MNEKIKSFFKKIYHKLVGINDTPHRKAGGLALGVFTGLLPAMGPVAALILAAIFRVNKAAAVIGSLLTNTWISLITLVLAIKIGSYMTGSNWHEHYNKVKEIFKHFEFKNLFDSAIIDILKPMFLGYLVIGGIFSGVVYAVAFLILKYWKHKKETHQ